MLTRTTLLILLFLALAGTRAWPTTIARSDEDGLHVVRIENARLVVRVAASSGARICSLTDKMDGVEQVWWRNDGRSGLLDDKAGLSAAAYAVTVEEAGPERVTVNFDAPAAAGALRLSKQLTVVEGEPAVRVEYVYRNTSAKRVHHRHMVRNYYLAGGVAGPEDRYFWRGPRGAESELYPYSGVGAWHDVIKPWYAAIDTKTETGLAVIVDSPSLRKFYNWADNSPTNPSIEWQVELKLPPGGSAAVPVTLALLKGLAGVTDASRDSVIHLRPATESTTLTMQARFYALTELLGDTRAALHCRYETLDRIFMWEEDGIHFPPTTPGEAVSGQTTYTPPQAGTYVLMAKTRNGGQTLNAFEIPVAVGRATGSYYKGRREKEQSRPLAVVTDKDIERGYTLHWGGPEAPFPPATPLELTLGNDEYESIELGVLALRDLGAVVVSVSALPALPAAAVQLRTCQGVSNPGESGTSPDRYGLVEGHTLEMPQGAHRAFWLTLRSHGIKPARYALTLTMQPANAPARSLPILVDVLNVSQAPRSEASLRMYYTLTYISPALKRHFELLSSHYIRQLQVHFPFNSWRGAVAVRRDESGELQIDFRRMDRRLKPALESGLDEIALMGRLDRDNWFAALSDESEEARTAARTRFGHSLVEHLLELGFTDVWVYALDEPSIPDATKPETIARLRRLEDAHPRLRVHTTINHYAPMLVSKLNSVIDVWTPNSSVCETMLEDIAKGVVTIDAADRIGFYRGGFLHSSPDVMRSYGWRAAFLGVKHYTVYAYNQGYGPERPYIIFGKGPNGPVTTPALEGLRDGFEDHAYWRRLLMLLEQTSTVDRATLTKQKRQAIADALSFRDRAFGTTADALIPLTPTPGGHGARPGHGFKQKDRHAFGRAKGVLLRHIAALHGILDQR